MPFKLLTLLQFVQILSLYLLVAVCLPAWVFHRKLSNFPLSARLLFYDVIGNFFVINLVFLLQLLHISNRVTLAFGTAAAAIFFGVRNNGLKPAAAFGRLWKSLKPVVCGGTGYRTLFLNMCRGIRKAAGRAFAALRRYVRGRALDLLLVLVVTVIFFLRFGVNLLNTYGYAASDMIVHNYWVNALSEGKLFVAGVYPYGFHCLMYYMHELFGIDNYVLLRIFWIVQTLLAFYGLLVFLKGCCKNRYLPYLGVAGYLFATLGVLANDTYLRFFSSLPQNFGMVFILPAVQFLFLFFEKKKAELDHGGAAGKDDRWCLAGFAMSLALAISIHFYNAMVIGLFCVGGLVGYGFRLFRKQYFLSVIAAGMIAAVIAAFPMVVAVLNGTPLEGSLNWGLSIMKNPSAAEETGMATLVEEGVVADHADVQPKPNIREAMEWELRTYVIRQEYHAYVKYLMYVFYLLPLVGILFWLLGHRDYGGRMVTIGCCLWLLIMMMAAGKFGLPSLMDEMRASFYTAWVLAAGIILLADALLYGLTGWIHRMTIKNAIALTMVAAALSAGFASGRMNSIRRIPAYQLNEAVVCLANILSENQDLTWTILSANDELRMADDHGYHYELIDFLEAMEGRGDHASVTIPSQYVYIFVEKIPQDYREVSYEGSGQRVSRAGAARALPAENGIGRYQLENRWIIMSRMYYWAQEFQKLYPNELKVYYETDSFVCYYMEQNTYSLYNMAIDYGYNVR